MRIYLAILCYIGLGSSSAQGQYLGDFLAQGHSSLNESQLIMVGKVQQQILRNTKQEPAHNPLKLARLFVEIAEEHNLDPMLLSAIAAVESNYFVGAINRRSNDFGIMQINVFNIRAMKLSKHRLLTDLRYSIEAGALVLKYFKRRYKAREPGRWFARYNCGTGSWRRVCAVYAAKVRRRL